MISYLILCSGVLGNADDQGGTGLVRSSAPGRLAVLAPQRMADLVAESREHLVSAVALVEDDQGCGVVVLAEPGRSQVAVFDVDAEVSAVL